MCGGTSETVLAEEERSPGPALGDCWEGGPESQARGGELEFERAEDPRLLIWWGKWGERRHPCYHRVPRWNVP